MNFGKNLLLLLFYSVYMFVYSNEYLYPVASLYDRSHKKILLYVLHQKSTDHLELWLWDSCTKIAQKALLSTCTPAGLQVLRNSNGFSFIDHGRIRLQKFDQPLFQTLTLTEPIYNITLIHWLDDELWYLSAKYNNNYGIFLGSSQGSVSPLLIQEGIDYKYPNIQDNTIFYIKQTESYCSIMQRQLNLPDKKIDTYEACLYDSGERPAIFLNMISNQLGFFVEHESSIYTHQAVISCSYHQLLKNNEPWQHNTLFEFNVPIHLLLPEYETCLHESLLPLTPRYYDGYIFFCTTQREEETMFRRRAVSLDIYFYHIASQKQLKLSQAKIGQFFFSPIVAGGQLFYGGSLGEYEQEMPYMYMNESGEVCFHMPCVDLVELTQ